MHEGYLENEFLKHITELYFPSEKTVVQKKNTEVWTAFYD